MTTLMPIASVRSLARAAARVSFAGALLFGTAAASAQEVKPATPPPPPVRLTQPATAPLLAPPKAPPPPVGAKAAVIGRTAVPAVVQQVKREGLPVESVRLESGPVAAPDPKFAPEKSSAPPAPRAFSQVQPTSARASSVSAQAPVGASARCKDGTFAFGSIEASTCETNGGLAVRIPARPAPPKRSTP